MQLQQDPIVQFQQWFEESKRSHIRYPESMVLATATREGKPSARVVLFKGFRDQSFVFFTNYNSPKGQDLDENPLAELVFHWVTLGRQVRVFGEVQKVPREVSEQYFQSRPKGSQLSAWASQQSEVIPDKDFLHQAFIRVQKKYESKSIPCPPYWGGYCVIPTYIEFWMEQADRLHDRYRYIKGESHGWEVLCLSP